MTKQRPSTSLPASAKKLRTLFDTGRELTLKEMEQALDLTERHVNRIINHLRSIGLPIRESRRGRIKVFVLPADRQQVDLPDLRFEQAELHALAVAVKASRAMLAGTPHTDALSRAFEKLLERARPVTYIFDSEETLREWQFEENATDTISADCFRKLETAMDERCSVRIDYQKGSDQSLSLARKIDPYFFTKRGRAWMVIAYCHNRKALRNFSIMGIKKVTLCDSSKEETYFEIPPKLVPADYFRGTMGAINSEESYELRLLIEPDKALYFRQRKYHPTQMIEEERPDGRLLVSFELEGFEEMRSFCQSWGLGITVLDPVELRERLKQEAQELAKRYKQ